MELHPQPKSPHALTKRDQRRADWDALVSVHVNPSEKAASKGLLGASLPAGGVNAAIDPQIERDPHRTATLQGRILLKATLACPP